LVAQGRKKEFLEFASVFKGKSQLYWSTGLKKKAGVEEIKDEDIADKEDKADVLGSLTPEDWTVIVENNARAKVLEIAESEGILPVRVFVHKLRSNLEPIYQSIN